MDRRARRQRPSRRQRVAVAALHGAERRRARDDAGLLVLHLEAGGPGDLAVRHQLHAAARRQHAQEPAQGGDALDGAEGRRRHHRPPAGLWRRQGEAGARHRAVVRSEVGLKLLFCRVQLGLAGALGDEETGETGWFFWGV